MPRLKSKLLKDDEGIKSSAAVDEVVCTTGKTSVEGMNIVGVKDDSLRRMLEEKCGAETVVVDGMDAIIASLIELLPSSNYTVVYSTTPVDLTIPFPLDSEPESGKQSGDDDSSSSNNSEPPTVRYKFNEYDDEVYHGAEKLLNLQVKRDTNAYQGRNDDDDDGDAKKGHHSIPGGVFERYQFLSPGIFMGFFAAFFFIIIIYVGISAITSLEISYGSFARDTSPQSAKKTQ
ncbi:hypothetical protein KEM54_000429 [Ascosphaera aggregata]|nr:hypothetical protein KEM54_000429 [Ascosphaera aggregata]